MCARFFTCAALHLPLWAFFLNPHSRLPFSAASIRLSPLPFHSFSFISRLSSKDNLPDTWGSMRTSQTLKRSVARAHTSTVQACDHIRMSTWRMGVFSMLVRAAFCFAERGKYFLWKVWCLIAALLRQWPAAGFVVLVIYYMTVFCLCEILLYRCLTHCTREELKPCQI